MYFGNLTSEKKRTTISAGEWNVTFGRSEKHNGCVNMMEGFRIPSVLKSKIDEIFVFCQNIYWLSQYSIAVKAHLVHSQLLQRKAFNWCLFIFAEV